MLIGFFTPFLSIVCLCTQMTATPASLFASLFSSLLSWLGRTDSLDVGCVMVGGGRLSVSFSLPYGYTDCKQASTCACDNKHKPGVDAHTLWLALTWPFGFCSTTTSHISSAALALTFPPLLAGSSVVPPQTAQRSNVPSCYRST